MTKDPELRHTTGGTAVARMTVAIDEGKNKAGEKQTTFVDVVIFSATAENAVKFLKKGSPVFIDGRLQIRSYDDEKFKDANGNPARRKVTEIVANRVVFLPNGSKKADEAPWPDEIPPEFGGAIDESDVPF